MESLPSNWRLLTMLLQPVGVIITHVQPMDLLLLEPTNIIHSNHCLPQVPTVSTYNEPLVFILILCQQSPFNIIPTSNIYYQECPGIYFLMNLIFCTQRIKSHFLKNFFLINYLSDCNIYVTSEQLFENIIRTHIQDDQMIKKSAFFHRLQFYKSKCKLVAPHTTINFLRSLILTLEVRLQPGHRSIRRWRGPEAEKAETYEFLGGRRNRQSSDQRRPSILHQQQQSQQSSRSSCYSFACTDGLGMDPGRP